MLRPPRRSLRIPRGPLSPLLILGLLGSCTGSIETPGRTDEQPGGPSDDDTVRPGAKPSPTGGTMTKGPSSPMGGTGVGMPAAADGAGVLPLRRLTQVEYTNTVRDLFQNPNLLVDLDPDPKGESGFAEAPLVGADTAKDLLFAAQTVAAAAVTKVNLLTTCDPTTRGEDACVRDLLTGFGRKVYRRPLPTAEVDSLAALHAKVRKDARSSFSDGVRVVLTAMLMSPQFLYHWELGGDRPTLEGQTIKLGGYQLAARLSYFLWSSLPDEDLLRAAAAGQLDDEAGVAGQVTRMMSDEKFQRAVESFHTQWLGLGDVLNVSKDPKLYPQVTDALKQAMVRETTKFVTTVFSSSGDGRLGSLLGSTRSFANAALAKVYDVKGVTGDELQPVNLDPGQRAGVLTQASLIFGHTNASGTNPARMGAMVRENFLCGQLAPPPPGAATTFMFDDALTTRANFERIQAMPTCGGCHALINPLGYVYEQYDAIGRYRTSDKGQAVNASGVFKSSTGERPYASVTELAGIMSDNPDVQACLGRLWLRFAVARLEAPGDTASLGNAMKAFTGSSLDLRKLVAGIATSRTFRYRAQEAGEVAP